MNMWDGIHPREDLYDPDETRIDRLVYQTLHAKPADDRRLMAPGNEHAAWQEILTLESWME